MSRADRIEDTIGYLIEKLLPSEEMQEIATEMLTGTGKHYKEVHILMRVTTDWEPGNTVLVGNYSIPVNASTVIHFGAYHCEITTGEYWK